MKIVLINLPLLSLKGDYLGSGIPSLPVGTTYLAAYLRIHHHEPIIIDAFGEKPHQSTCYKEKYVVWGLTLTEIILKISPNADLIAISVHSGETYSLSLELIRMIKQQFPVPLVVGGAFPTINYQDYITAGADFVVLSEGEQTLLQIVESFSGKVLIKDIDGIAYAGGMNPKTKFIEDLDTLPFPAIDLLPLKKYWELGYAHGPVSGKYIFLITSRGCPFNCNFCAAPAIWQKKWRTRSPKNVVDEMEFHHQKYGITDFHIQDDNMTFNRDRVVEICKEILIRNLHVTWKLAAGMKVETIDEETLEWMKKAGCNYISISPETGSKNVLKLMNKPFNFEYAKRIVKKANNLGIKVQACFVLGFPGETDDDLKMTKKYMRTLTKVGLDEIGLFIMTPLPGARSYDQFDHQEYEELTFSPTWRLDYPKLEKIRIQLYLDFFLIKFINHPLKMVKSVYNIVTRKFEIKMEMTFYRILRWKFIERKCAL
jgi:anaerobic magnesium-protoporphyrin IX monomethyl ester cyclase